MNETTSSYSTISSAWYALVFGEDNVRRRLANALHRIMNLPSDTLSDSQRSAFLQLRVDRIRKQNLPQIVSLVDSLDESKVHQLADTIAYLYITTVRPAEN